MQSVNLVRINYAYPTSAMAEELGRLKEGCYYVEIGLGVYSPPFRFLSSAEGWCRNHCLTWEPHRFAPDRN